MHIVSKLPWNGINQESCSWLLVYERETGLDNTKKQNIETSFAIWTPWVWTAKDVSLFSLISCGFAGFWFWTSNWTRKSKKLKTETGNEKVLRSEPPCLIRFQLQKGLFIEKIQFLLERCLVSVLGMRALFIVENHIPVHCRSEFIFGTVFCSVEFLTL